MTKSEMIKVECELMYENIRLSENRLKELRAECNHENTFEGHYSWRVGCVDPAIICSDCGSLIKMIASYSTIIADDLYPPPQHNDSST